MDKNRNRYSNRFRGLKLEQGNMVTIDITKLRLDASDCDCFLDCNELANIFKINGADVKGEYTEESDGKQILMYIYNLSDDYVVYTLQNFIADADCECIDDVEQYIVDDDFPAYDEVEDMNDFDDFPAYDDVNINENFMEGDSMVVDSYDLLYERALKAVKIYVNEMRANGEPLPDFMDQETTDELLSLIVPDINVLEDRDIERLSKAIADCYDAEMANLNEKRKGCCPPKKALSESVDTVLNDIQKNNSISEKVLKALKANKPYLYENVKVGGKLFKDMSIKELKAMANTLLKSKKTLTESLKNTLNESVAYKQVKEELNIKNQLLNYIDEELTYRETRINCIKKLYEDGKISDDELENLFGPGQGEEDEKDDKSESDNKSEENNNTSKESDNKSEENNNTSEESEEFELARIEITLKTPEAVIDLKKACIDADIPEDAIELEGVDDDAFEDDENKEGDDENTEENKESEENTEETSEENASESNESIHYNNIARLFEDDEPDENTEGDNDENTENDNADSDENKDENDEDEKEEKYKLVLINTDYAENLAKVLNDLYGITKEEFEEMIGGTIVSEDNSDEDTEKSDSDENEESNEKDDSDEKKEDSKDDTDDIDPEELFKGL